ncbi:hypothetical protein KB874_22215 [Aestuariicoccus sp. KMU-90]|uniref:Uncharacterized protein n=1 Tax=Thetidibacter halocola TaxID=2827239 RepID=A0A8J8BAD6_9RHOB|nr:hypothetical protein [Thetidibacter halocola]
METGIFGADTMRLDGPNNAPVLGEDTITKDEDSFTRFQIRPALKALAPGRLSAGDAS